jgi:hypothetical protein
MKHNNVNIKLTHFNKFLYKASRDRSLGIATDYGLDDQMIGILFPMGSRNVSLRYHVQIVSGTHPASYSMGNRDSFPGDKAAMA